VLEARQGFKTMSPACKDIQRLILSGKVDIPTNPVLRWMFDNVSIVEDEAQNIKPVKRNNAAKIDLVVAWGDAQHAHILPEPNQDDYYATHDIFVAGGK
jgi:phage terminase large subunit-like protein